MCLNTDCSHDSHFLSTYPGRHYTLNYTRHLVLLSSTLAVEIGPLFRNNLAQHMGEQCDSSDAASLLSPFSSYTWSVLLCTILNTLSTLMVAPPSFASSFRGLRFTVKGSIETV